jgi:hypothetical protein
VKSEHILAYLSILHMKVGGVGCLDFKLGDFSSY